jgi:DNA topoisomerase-1
MRRLRSADLGERRHDHACQQLPLTIWFWAAFLMATHSNGISALQLQHQLGLGSYRGKSGCRNETDINDPRLARVVKACRDLPGHELFQYVDDAGERHTVTSTEVNAYLHEITGEDTPEQ